MARSRSCLISAALLGALAAVCGWRFSCFVQPGQGRRGLLLAVTGAGVAAVSQEQAEAGPKTSATWQGRYADPQHPGCKREIAVDIFGVVVKVSDGNPGCLNGEPQKNYLLRADYKPGSETITIDFSPKGGPADVTGTWDGTGIRFPDGNRWKKLF